MSYWGKLLGGMAGFAMGGPFGAMFGMALGHAADAGTLPRFSFGDALSATPLTQARLAAAIGQKEQVFAIAAVVLAAKLAKCDGPVVRAEIDAFKQHFRIPPESMREMARLFDQSRDSADGFEPYARQLGESFAGDRATLENVLAALFAIARADKPVTVAELDMLGQVHAAFGLDQLAWDQARGAAAPPLRSTAEDPYAVLGESRSATDGALRAAWLRQVRENHPDRLAARGLSPEAVARAGDKVARINAAWDQIKRERRM